MRRLNILLCAAILMLSSSGTTQASDIFKKVTDGLLAARTGTSASGLSNADIASGLRDALRVGTGNVVGKLGKANGFNLDPKIHIPLPGTLQKVDKALTLVGMSHLTDDLELRINRAAEAATPQAKQLFLNAIQKMTITDARAILTGPQDSATQYFKKAMSPDLAKALSPLVKTALAEAGAVQSYDRVMGQYNKIPLVSGVKENLTNYAVNKTMDGIFY